MSIPSTQQMHISKTNIEVANQYIHMQVKKIKKYLLQKYDIPIMTDMSDTTELIVVPMPPLIYDNEDYCSNFEEIIRAAFNIFGLQTVSLEWFRHSYYHTNCYRHRYWSINVAHHIRFWITPITGHRNTIVPVRKFKDTWDLDEQEITYTSYKENKLSIDEYFGDVIDIGTITVCCYVKDVIRTPPPSPIFDVIYNSNSENESDSDKENIEAAA